MGCCQSLQEQMEELKELFLLLADDAGYTLDDPPKHWCWREQGSGEGCLTCEIWTKVKEFL